MSKNKTIAYYSSLGSRVGYTLVAGGHKHFGYHADKWHWYIPHAAVAMIDHLADFAGLKPGERVLDAGCGEGRASLRLAEKYGADVTGIDMVPQALGVARKRARNTTAKVEYLEGDYNRLPFDDGTFDMVFTLETFTHTSDPHATLRELWRVLKPGGRIVIFDYSIRKLDTLPPGFKEAMVNIAKGTDCPGFTIIDHDYYANNLPLLGMDDFDLENLTDKVSPSLWQMYVLSWLPYQVMKALGKADHHPNLLISHFGWPGGKQDLTRYVTLRIRKPAS